MKKLKLKVPKSLRFGQNIHNFLSWLKFTGRVKEDSQSHFMADTFYVSDEDFVRYYEEYLKEK